MTKGEAMEAEFGSVQGPGARELRPDLTERDYDDDETRARIAELRARVLVQVIGDDGARKARPEDGEEK